MALVCSLGRGEVPKKFFNTIDRYQNFGFLEMKLQSYAAIFFNSTAAPFRTFTAELRNNNASKAPIRISGHPE